MITVPFSELIDIDSDIWRLVNKEKFPSLYPSGYLPDEVIENINSYFYDREICYSSPERFLRQWWRLIKERAYTWKKLLETETVLRDEDMLFNYDLNESSEDERSGSGSTRSETSPNLKTQTVPEVVTVQDTKSGQTISIHQSGESSDSTDSATHEMDTPDGITNDIDNYLSRASTNDETASGSTKSRSSQINAGDNRSVTRQTGESWQYQTGSTTSESESESIDKNTHSLRRYGNIGTMTVASVLGGYREAQSFDAYSSVIFPECEMLFLHYVDIDDIDIW